MTCKSRGCELYSDYAYWYNFDVRKADNPYKLCDTDLSPSMPDDCSRCRRAYRDLFRSKP